MKFGMTCTCGHEVSVDAESREEAVKKIKGIMTEEAIAAHFAEKHSGEALPTKAQNDAMIEQMVQSMSSAAAM